MQIISTKYMILVNPKYVPTVPINTPIVTPIASALLAREYPSLNLIWLLQLSGIANSAEGQ